MVHEKRKVYVPFFKLLGVVKTCVDSVVSVASHFSETYNFANAVVIKNNCHFVCSNTCV